MADNPLDPHHLFQHVQDSPHIEVYHKLDFHGEREGKIYLPQPWVSDTTVALIHPKNPLLPNFVLTKFMVIEVAVALVLTIVFIRLACRMRGGKAPKGRWWNLLETMLVFVRDEVARPAIGHHDGDKFLPFLWTMFFFILGCNLVGLLPWSGSPTGALATTAALAMVTFLTVLGAGIAKMGPFGFLKNLVPHMDLPIALAIFLWPMIFVLEVGGLLIKHVVLAIRLLANMMAGHLVLAVLVGFVVMTAGKAEFWGVMPASVLGATALSLLELFVAFLQAYIFTFLSALFIGMVVHSH
jgi:F-type H+-transporting ATPase subunit a